MHPTTIASFHNSIPPYIHHCIHPPIHNSMHQSMFAYVHNYIPHTCICDSIIPLIHLSLYTTFLLSIHPFIHPCIHHSKSPSPPCITSIQSCIIFIHPCSPLSVDPKWPGWRWRRACWCRRSRNPSLQAQTPNRAQGSWRGACGSRQHRHAADLWPQQPAWRWPAGSGTLPWSLARRRRTVCRTQRPNRICKIHTFAQKQGQRHSVWESIRDHGIMTSRGLAGLRKLQGAWHSWLFVFNGNSFLWCGEEFRFVRARCEEGV